MNQATWIKPRWSPLNIFLMVLGFIVFWPLGLAMIFYMSWGRRWVGRKRRAEKHHDRAKAPERKDYHFGRAASGDFGERRQRELDQIESERRTLDEMKARRGQSSAERNSSKDRDEFTSFMHKRRRKQGDEGAQNA